MARLGRVGRSCRKTRRLNKEDAMKRLSLLIQKRLGESLTGESFFKIIIKREFQKILKLDFLAHSIRPKTLLGEHSEMLSEFKFFLKLIRQMICILIGKTFFNHRLVYECSVSFINVS